MAVWLKSAVQCPVEYLSGKWWDFASTSLISPWRLVTLVKCWGVAERALHSSGKAHLFGFDKGPVGGVVNNILLNA